MRNFNEVTSLYIKNLGYKTDIAMEDKMFIYKLNESDFLALNFILVPLAFEYSILGRINIRFWTHSRYSEPRSRNSIGILRYEFTVSNDFQQTHKDMLMTNYLERIGSIEYIDLFLAALIAENNGLKLNVGFAGDNGSRVYIDLIFDAQYQPN
jgi:hypothetical protein